MKIHSENLSQAQLSLIQEFNHKYVSVFNQDLSNGYNHNTGSHVCRLNFSDQSRPRARKIRCVNYDNDTNVLLQNVIDELTDQKVLGFPQDYKITPQTVSPCSKNQLTTDNVCLVVNVNEVSQHMKTLP